MRKAQHLRVGEQGEDIAVSWLKKKGFSIKERNFWKKWGEIDIIAEKDNVVHFVEVKSTSCTTFSAEEEHHFLPEENMHMDKKARLGRAIESYLLEHRVSEKQDWCVALCVVYLNTTTRKARVNYYDDIVLE